MARQSSRSRDLKDAEGEKQELLEKLSELEHKQWVHYSKNVAKQIKQANSLEQLIKSTNKKWAKNWKDYSALSEVEKTKDREWALKVLQTLEDNKQLLDDILNR